MPGPQRNVGYQEVAAQLREQIRSGRLKPGARLPSETDLVQIYGVALETGRRAVRQLVREGLVVVRHGYPTRVAEVPERTEVRLPRHTVMTARPPTAEEIEEYGGTWMTEAHLFGRHVGTWPADRTAFVVR